ncbi:HAD-like domain-containing protein [Gamsiella multidivaricata]|uniref:HAD-like domain-containing protein n=1 Tax=Gamsiella multidivaricata TaxID=101098 RepID=UPI002220951F|nr:HAD-like domain-containing protein [Gamsiella multidivaricata]KAI7818606.1 HAD-like domain-containing protein [Gamsiella multidivaricata]
MSNCRQRSITTNIRHRWDICRGALSTTSLSCLAAQNRDTDRRPHILQFHRGIKSSCGTDHGSATHGVQDERVFFFDIDNCLYPKSSGIPYLMKQRIEQYFRDSGIPHHEVETLAHRYYVDYGLAIRGLIEKHPDIDISDYDDKVDGGLPLENILKPKPPLRDMIRSMKVGKKWLFTNAGKYHANRVIKILGLQGLFDGMTFCNYLEPHFVCKPDRKAFEKAMKEARVQNPAFCYFVDDSAPNIAMAIKMGWTAVHVDECLSELPPVGHFQIHSVVDLPKVLPQFWDHGESELRTQKRT